MSIALTIIAVEWRELSHDNRPGLPGWVPEYTYRAGNERPLVYQHAPSVRRISVWILPLP